MADLSEINNQKNKLKPTTTIVRENTFVDATPYNKPHADVEDDVREFYESDINELQKKVKKMAQIMRESKYITAYTGAGLSTSTGIPDYRGPTGAWTLREKGLSMRATTTIESACPSFSHMSLTQLYKKNIVKHIITTNLDGLHRRADTPRDGLAILHGDAYEEKCADCQKTFFRDFDCTKLGTRLDHKTGRKCEDCGGDLLDSIINFGENLPEKEFYQALQESEKADLTIVLGTSMQVQPACKLPLICPKNNGGKMIICNKQKTEFDNLASVRIFADLDDIFLLLMKELEIDVPTETSQKMPIHVPLLDQIDQRLKQAKQGFLGSYSSESKPKEDTTPEKGEVQKLRKQVTALGIGSAFLGNQDAKRFITAQNTASPTILDGLKKQTLAYFSKCKSAEFILKGNCAKTIIDDCTDVKIVLNAMHMTGHLEVINCTNLHLVFEERIPTVTVDNTNGLKLELPIIFNAPTLFLHKSSNVSIGVQEDDRSVEYQDIDQDNKNKEDQMRVRILNEKSTQSHLHKIVEEVVIREGNGYATTVEEKKQRDLQDEKNKIAMMNNMKNMISFKSKNNNSQNNQNGKEEQTE